VIGSVVSGISDVEVSNCYFNKGTCGWGNGIGKCDNIRIKDSTIIDGSVNHGGGRTANSVNYQFYPWIPGRSVIEGCTFLQSKPGTPQTQGVRLTDWYDMYANCSGLLVRRNNFILPTGVSCIMQGLLKAPVTWEENNFVNNDSGNPLHLGTIYLHQPNGTPFPDTTSFIKMGTGDRKNNVPAGSFFSVSGAPWMNIMVK
jgi:hypothetical protein